MGRIIRDAGGGISCGTERPVGLEGQGWGLIRLIDMSPFRINDAIIAARCALREAQHNPASPAMD